MNAPIARQDRSTISRRPRRSATRPQIGDIAAANRGVMQASTPAQRLTAAGSLTPIWGRKSGMIGASTVKPAFIPICSPIITASVRRQFAEPSSAIDRLAGSSGGGGTDMPSFYPHRPGPLPLKPLSRCRERGGRSTTP